MWKKIDLNKIGQEPVIMLKEGFYHNKIVNDRFIEAGINPNIIYSSNQLDTIKSFVRHNVGSTFLIKEIVRNEEEILSIPLAAPIEVNIGLVWNSDRYLPRIVKELIDFIGKAAFWLLIKALIGSNQNHKVWNTFSLL